jgi:PAS domain S-box-containing protein
MMGTVSLPPDGDIMHLYDNPATTRFFGLLPGQTHGRTARALGVPEPMIALWRRHYDAAGALGRHVTFEYVHDHPRGPRTVRVTVSPLPVDPLDRPRFGYIAEDVTDRRRAEAERAESEASFAALFEQAAVGMALVGLDGSWLRVNQRLCAMLGYEEAEIRRLTFQQLTHPDDLALDMAQVQRLLRGEASAYAMEKRYFRKDGQVMWAQLTVSLLRDAGGRPDRFVSVVEDIGARKAAEEAVTLGQRRLEMATGAAALGVWEWATGDQLVHYSPRARDIAGFSPDEPVTIEKVLAATHPDDRALLVERTGRAWSADDQLGAEYRVVHPERGERWVRAYSTGAPDEGGGVRLFGTIEDVTAQRQAEERLRLLMREVDHRANNLLTVVQSVVALTRADAVEPFRRALDGRIQAMARAHQLLAASRWEGADLRRLAQEELKPYGLGEDGRIFLEGPPVHVSPAQAQALGLALHELATNAAKYGALSLPAGWVRVDWSGEGGLLELTWREGGGPPVTVPTRRGFGTTILAHSLGGSLGGFVEMDWAPEGVTARLVLPLAMP